LDTNKGSPLRAASSRVPDDKAIRHRRWTQAPKTPRANLGTAVRLSASFAVAGLLSLAAPGSAIAPAVAHTAHPANSAPADTVPVAASASRPSGDRAPAASGIEPSPAGGSGRTCQPAPSETVEADPNERLRFGDMEVPRWIVDTIRRAAAETGVDPVYLMALADKESSFLVEARPSTSSAEGLFQFIAGTWLQVVKAYGAKHGRAAEAAAIVSAKGQLSIPDGDTRERILNLRRDPYLSALMAAEMLKRDRARIEPKVGRNLDATDSYLAHFLGADSAGRFMALLGDKPEQSAQKALPKAARANRSLFFAREGKKVRQLTVAEVYDRIDRMMDHRVERYEGVAAAPPVEEFLERLARL
jgi:Transglycosylase SLT domain